MSKIDESTVRIRLGDRDVELVATLEGTILMSRAYGGLKRVVDLVKDLDIEAMAVVIRAGMLVDGEEAKAILDDAFKAGLVNLIAPLVEFVLICANGGVLPSVDPEEGAEPGKP